VLDDGIRQKEWGGHYCVWYSFDSPTPDRRNPDLVRRKRRLPFWIPVCCVFIPAL
jgi:hypothetical protein